jgi:hypothetical protein
MKKRKRRSLRKFRLKNKRIIKRRKFYKNNRVVIFGYRTRKVISLSLIHFLQFQKKNNKVLKKVAIIFFLSEVRIIILSQKIIVKKKKMKMMEKKKVNKRV